MVGLTQVDKLQREALRRLPSYHLPTPNSSLVVSGGSVSSSTATIGMFAKKIDPSHLLRLARDWKQAASLSGLARLGFQSRSPSGAEAPW